MELLSPAGSFEALKIAVANGANAVYLGLNKFSARAKATNFDMQTVKEAIKYAHLFNVKVYVAMNTLLYEKELVTALNLAKELKNMQVDALIIQDLGLATLLKKELPNLTLHASTQMGIHNLEGAVVAKSLGFSRIILSREATLEDIERIKLNCDIELEFFCHGALCVAFSGNCYMSSIVSRNSGNRGKCLQLCRKQYVLSGKSCYGQGYFLSTKDVNLSNHLKKLQNVGICSLKIEGRMRKLSYVETVTKVYRKILDNNFLTNNKFDATLQSVYIRDGGCSSHLFNKTSNTICDIKNGHKTLIHKPNNNKNTIIPLKNELPQKTLALKTNFDNSFFKKPQNDIKIYKHVVMVDSLQKFKLVKAGADCVIYSPFIYDKADIEKFVGSVCIDVYLNLPLIARTKDIDKLKDILSSPKIKNVVANNLYALELAKDKNIMLGMGLNLINNTLNYQRILSIEAKGAFSDSDIVYAFGYPNLMTFCHCFNHTLNKSCKSCTNENLVLTDETRAKFKIKRTKVANCYHGLFNNIPINATNLLKQKNATNAILFDFCGFEISELKNFDYSNLTNISKNFTKGHLYRGVD